MKHTSTVNRFLRAVATGLALATISTRAQDVAATGSLTFVPAGGGVYDYTLTLSNTGPEAIEGFWLGWALSSSPVFNVLNPTKATNNLGWSSPVDGNSVKYGGSASETTILSGGSGIFTFNSTSTPAQFRSGAAGQSVAYGVDATQFAIEDNSLHSVEFSPAVVFVPPSVSITNPASGAVFAAPAAIAIQASTSDSDGTVTNVQLLIGATVLTNAASPPFAAVANNLPAGSYTLKAIALDNNGSTSTNTVEVAVVTPLSPAISLPQFSSPGFQFSYAANVGLNYVVQRSTDLAAPDWISLSTNLAGSNPVVFTDNFATNNRAYYRVGLLPNP